MPDALTPAFQEATQPAPRCPECNGEQLVGHPGGLVFVHDTLGGCSLQDKEDARVVADQDRGGSFTRPATPTERTLLAAAGYVLPANAVTVVDYLTTAVRRRQWPAAVAVSA